MLAYQKCEKEKGLRKLEVKSPVKAKIVSWVLFCCN